MGNNTKVKKLRNIRNELIEKSWILFIILGITILIAIVSFIVYGLWYSRQCNIIYNQISNYCGSKDVTIYGEYDNQTVEIAYGNRNSVWNSISEKMVKLSSSKKTPTGEYVMIQFDDKLKMTIYETESKDVFVKYATEKATKYFYINESCDFSMLKKMVSLEGWNVENTLAR